MSSAKSQIANLKFDYSDTGTFYYVLGSLADFYEHDGTDSILYDLIKDRIQYMNIAEHKKLMFDWKHSTDVNKKYSVSVWILRIENNENADDFRFCYSSQGIQEQKVLRGWNQ